MSALPVRLAPKNLEQLLSQSVPKPQRERLKAQIHPRNSQFFKTTQRLTPTVAVPSNFTPKSCTAHPDCAIFSLSLTSKTYVNFALALISSLPKRRNSEKVINLFLRLKSWLWWCLN